MIIYARLLPNSSTPRALKERHQHAPKSPQLTSTDCTRKKQVDDGTVQSWLNWAISNGKHLRTIGSSTVSHPLHQDQGSIIWSRCSHEPGEGTNDCAASSHYSAHYTWNGGECILAPCTHRLFYRMFPYAFFLRPYQHHANASVKASFRLIWAPPLCPRLWSFHHVIKSGVMDKQGHQRSIIQGIPSLSTSVDVSHVWVDSPTFAGYNPIFTVFSSHNSKQVNMCSRMTYVTI